MRKLKDKYKLVGVSFKEASDENSREVFHEYVEMTMKLANNERLRQKICKHRMTINLGKILFQGNAENFLKSVEWLYQKHENLSKDNNKLIKPAC